MNFKNNEVMIPYISMIQSLEFFCKDETNSISINDYKNGSTFFVFNLTPDLSHASNCGQCTNN